MTLHEVTLCRSISQGGNEPPPLPPVNDLVRSASDTQVPLPAFGLQIGLEFPDTHIESMESETCSETSIDDVDAISCQEPDPAVVRQLDLDLPRTHGQNPIMKRRLSLTRNILLREASVDSELGYCQGMNLVAAAFAFSYHSEARAFKRFHSFVQRVRGLWLVSFPLLEKGTQHFEVLASQRPWFHHLVEQNVDSQTYLPQQWMTLFALWLPLPTLEMCIEFFECEGFAGMLAMSLALFDHIGPVLLTMDQDGLLESFSAQGLVKLRQQLPDAPALARTVGAWLPMAIAEYERALEDRVDTKILRSELAREGSRVVSPSQKEVFSIASFFESLSDFAEEANDSLIKGTTSLVKAGEDAVERARQDAVEMVRRAGQEANATGRAVFQATGRAMFQSLISRRPAKKAQLIKHWSCPDCGEENRLRRTECNNCGRSRIKR